MRPTSDDMPGPRIGQRLGVLWGIMDPLLFRGVIRREPGLLTAPLLLWSLVKLFHANLLA